MGGGETNNKTCGEGGSPEQLHMLGASLKKYKEGESCKKHARVVVEKMWGRISIGIFLNISYRAISFEILVGVRKYVGWSCGKI